MTYSRSREGNMRGFTRGALAERDGVTRMIGAVTKIGEQAATEVY